MELGVSVRVHLAEAVFEGHVGSYLSLSTNKVGLFMPRAVDAWPACGSEKHMTRRCKLQLQLQIIGDEVECVACSPGARSAKFPSSRN